MAANLKYLRCTVHHSIHISPKFRPWKDESAAQTEEKRLLCGVKMFPFELNVIAYPGALKNLLDEHREAKTSTGTLSYTQSQCVSSLQPSEHWLLGAHKSKSSNAQKSEILFAFFMNTHLPLGVSLDIKYVLVLFVQILRLLSLRISPPPKYNTWRWIEYWLIDWFKFILNM